MLRRRRFRTVVREQADGGWTVSAEKGFLKETGNLLFHFALLAVLIGVGLRALVRLARQPHPGGRAPTRASATSLTQYDDSVARPPGGRRPTCRTSACKLTGFDATYQATGQPKSFRATVAVSEDGGAGPDRDVHGQRPAAAAPAPTCTCSATGYAPVLRYTDRFGVAQTKVVPFLPIDGMLTSEGVAQFPDVNIDPKTEQARPDPADRLRGRLPADRSAPTAAPPRRSRPRTTPALFLTAYRGDLGLDVGHARLGLRARPAARSPTGELKKVSGARPHLLHAGRDLDPGRRHQAGVRRHPAVRHALHPVRPDPVADAGRRGARAARADALAGRPPAPGLVPSPCRPAGGPGGGTLFDGRWPAAHRLSRFRATSSAALVQAAEEGTP